VFGGGERPVLGVVESRDVRGSVSPLKIPAELRLKVVGRDSGEYGRRGGEGENHVEIV